MFGLLVGLYVLSYFFLYQFPLPSLFPLPFSSLLPAPPPSPPSLPQNTQLTTHLDDPPNMIIPLSTVTIAWPVLFSGDVPYLIKVMVITIRQTLTITNIIQR